MNPRLKPRQWQSSWGLLLELELLEKIFSTPSSCPHQLWRTTAVSALILVIVHTEDKAEREESRVQKGVGVKSHMFKFLDPAMPKTPSASPSV